ncbi:substrate-binding periplasmic protein [Paenibacillus aceris]|uniref:Polar amino acid transport system substrate-binding protein/cystine transport system substrate-binding protein n=1 Tax=Paenibacillus aceris TaxID=869555 RepID=A0ABS4I6T5_9BACL|nr:ABC transporter substrate-binding protein [Paenibacillus aceris]MBP1966616.1 polar amino acid transport system substrate-binding protein/cystine transport system substrate-binding protein [Paenibacillus aceris]NHW38852.1 amino acid ABC transporter substrate-binding protein [Paenibacillus aceris]
MKRVKWMSMGLVITSLFLVAACGTKATTTGTSAKPSEQQAAGTASPAIAATNAPVTSQTVQQIKKNGKLVIGTSGNFRPMTFMNEQSQLTGLDIDIGTMIAEKLGVKVEFVPGNIAGLIPGLVAGKFDLVMSALSETDERKKSIDFSIPYGKDGTVAVTLKDSTKVEDVTKLNGLITGVIGGSATHTVIKEFGGFKELKEYPGNAEAFTDLKAGRIDLYAVGNIAANDYIKNDKSEKPLKLVGKVAAVKNMGVGLRKNEPELKAIIDGLIEEKMKDGTIDKLATKWVGAPLPK